MGQGSTKQENTDQISNLLTFHTIHGKNIQLSSDKKIANRTASFCYGIVFSGRPITINAVVHLKLAKVEKSWSGVMRLGVTAIDPSSLTSASLPRYACPDLTTKPGFWAKAIPEDICIENTKLSFVVNNNGQMHLSVNDIYERALLEGLPTTSPLWFVVDIYGNTSSLEILGEDQPTHAGMIVPPSTTAHYFEEAGDAVEDPSQAGERTFSSSNAINDSEEIANFIAPFANINNIEGIPDELQEFFNERGITLFDPNGGSIFSSNCGHGIYIQNGNIARQVYSELSQGPLEFDLPLSGLVFAAHPLQPGNMLFFNILGMSSQSRIFLGVTSCNPDFIDTDFLPVVPYDLVDREEYWIVEQTRTELAERDFLGIGISSDGWVRYKINNLPEENLFFCDVTQQLWVFVDLGNSIQELLLVAETESSSLNLNPSVPSTSRTDLRDFWLPISANSSSRNIAIPQSSDDEQSFAAESPVSFHRLELDSSSSESDDFPDINSSFPDLNRSLGNFLPGDTNSNTSEDEYYDQGNRGFLQRHNYLGRRLAQVVASTRVISNMRNRLLQVHTNRRSSSNHTPVATETNSDGTDTVSSTTDPPPVLPTVTEVLNNENQETSPTVNSTDHHVGASRSEPESSLSECTICCSEPANAAIYDCGHVCLCVACGNNLKSRNRFPKCPICRNPIKDIIRLYHA